MSNLNALQILATVLAGWVNQHQRAIIDYLMEESRIFKQQLQGRRLHLSENDHQLIVIGRQQ